MRILSLIGTLALLLQLSAVPGRAFSLIGPFSGWQTPDIGYDINLVAGNEPGGPRLRGDEYRLSTPVLTYGVDGAFFEFFGAPGMQALDAAFTVFNNLTNVSDFSADLSEFPLKADGVNPLARTLGLLDIKTTVMSYILSGMGLTAPDHWTWSIRARFVDGGGTPHYSVVNFNYDPITGLPSRYVNGTMYSYVIREVYDGNNAVVGYDAREIPVDSSAPTIALASLVHEADSPMDSRLIRAKSLFGRYFTGITRDDAGGLRYLYRPENFNYESAPAGSSRGSGVTSIGSSSGSLDSPWTIAAPGAIGTNAIGTTGTGRQLVNLGVRAGVDKIQFIRVDMDPILRVSPLPLVISYPELVISNGIVVSQVVVRTNTRPDILFSAADLGVALFTPIAITQSAYTYNNTGGTIIAGAEGPGNIEPTFGMQFSKVGVHNLNDGNSDEQDGTRGFLWSTFDGSTNAPVIFPIGSTLRELEEAYNALP